jgi:hypothetical protein
MTEQSQDQRTLAALRIELQPFPEDGRPVVFTVEDDSGATLPVTVQVRPGVFEDNADVLARIAAETAPASGELVYGGLEADRVLIGFDDHAAGEYALHVTIAYLGGDGSYQPQTLRAQASDAAVGRLADGVRQLKEAGQGTFDWQVAD